MKFYRNNSNKNFNNLSSGNNYYKKYEEVDSANIFKNIVLDLSPNNFEKVDEEDSQVSCLKKLSSADFANETVGYKQLKSKILNKIRWR